jgi:periplasmic divalent cation tolerance protein
MNASGKIKIVLVTVGSLAEGRRIARALIGKRLAACVNIVRAPVESIYRWKRKVTVAREYLLVIKTTLERMPQAQNEIRRLHRYEVPEIITLPVEGGHAEYLAWIRESVA